MAKANRVVGLMFRSFKNLENPTFVLLYKALVRPHLEYGSVVWSQLNTHLTKKIESVQRRATGRLPTMNGLSYEQRLRSLGLPTLEYRRLRYDMLQVFKIMNGLEDIDPESLICKANPGRTRGHQWKLKKERTRTARARKSFRHRVVDNWNELPERVVNATSMNEFKSRLNEAWKHHPIKFTPSFM
ncbi:MAG: hypothetical protein V2I33_18950 [Kangiellaceae bacterium]|nr:hypothetical protein [Kangiellaceae bacterium]